MRRRTYDARRRLLYASLTLAGVELGPEDETNSAWYDATLEYLEEELDDAARDYVAALDAENADAARERVRTVIEGWLAGDGWQDGAQGAVDVARLVYGDEWVDEVTDAAWGDD